MFWEGGCTGGGGRSCGAWTHVLVRAASGPAGRGRGPSLAQVLGGRRGAGRVRPAGGVRRRLRDHRRRWLALGDALGGGAALATGAVVAAVRLALRHPTGGGAGRTARGRGRGAGGALHRRAVDFFLLQIAANAASALAWTVSIVIRWPLLGLVVATALGQRTRWRRDPDLLRAYRLASWIWVGQYVARLGVFIPLYLVGAVYALGVAGWC